jgi:hypothetical protein
MHLGFASGRRRREEKKGERAERRRKWKATSGQEKKGLRLVARDFRIL